MEQARALGDFRVRHDQPDVAEVVAPRPEERGEVWVIEIRPNAAPLPDCLIQVLLAGGEAKPTSPHD